MALQPEGMVATSRTGSLTETQGWLGPVGDLRGLVATAAMILELHCSSESNPAHVAMFCMAVLYRGRGSAIRETHCWLAALASVLCPTPDSWYSPCRLWQLHWRLLRPCWRRSAGCCSCKGMLDAVLYMQIRYSVQTVATALQTSAAMVEMHRWLAAVTGMFDHTPLSHDFLRADCGDGGGDFCGDAGDAPLAAGVRRGSRTAAARTGGNALRSC